jgi:hypothetical protein
LEESVKFHCWKFWNILCFVKGEFIGILSLFVLPDSCLWRSRHVYDYEESETVLIFRLLAELWIVTSIFIMSCLFVCLPFCASVHMEHLCSHWMDIHEIWYLCIYQKSFKKIPVALKSDLRVLGTSHEELCSFMKSHWILLEWEMCHTKVAAKTKTYFLLRNFF